MTKVWTALVLVLPLGIVTMKVLKAVVPGGGISSPQVETRPSGSTARDTPTVGHGESADHSPIVLRANAGETSANEVSSNPSRVGQIECLDFIGAGSRTPPSPGALIFSCK